MTSSFDRLNATGLQTEFFQLIQTALYHADGMWGDATVDLYLRDLPAHYGYMVVAGVQEATQRQVAQARGRLFKAHQTLGNTVESAFYNFNVKFIQMEAIYNLNSSKPRNTLNSIKDVIS